jgi:hypothetical protein
MSAYARHMTRIRRLILPLAGLLSKGRIAFKLGPFRAGKRIAATAKHSGYTSARLVLAVKRP